MDGTMGGIMTWQSATPMPSYAQRQKDKDWEKKQRLREYRVAARRERRNRKADEKKQRKLNATILRRMVRNPEKYTKNYDRNRIVDIGIERRTIWNEAVRQAQELAFLHDQTGAKFNIRPVTRRGRDGKVVDAASLMTSTEEDWEKAEKLMPDPSILFRREGRPLSKAQLRKLFENVPRPPPPKPVIPDGFSLPEGEEDFLALWDLNDGEIYERIERIKREKYEARRALRKKQQAGKVERRAARDEKRRVYRDLKLTWRVIKAEQDKHKKFLKSVEDYEAQKIATELNEFERKNALDFCATLGFTLENTEGVEEVKLKFAGEAKHIDPDELIINEDGTEIQPKRAVTEYMSSRRIDLSQAASKETAYIGANGQRNGDAPGDFLRVDAGTDMDHAGLKLNNKVRRIIRRAVEHQKIERETLVRERAKKYLEEQGQPIPEVLKTSPGPVHYTTHRQLENGLLETAKQERVRAQLELAEYNNNARVLRRQAKARATESGLRVYAEMTGRIPLRDLEEQTKTDWGVGWHVPPDADPKDRIQPSDLQVL